MKCLAILALPLLIVSCAATPPVREVRVIQEWTPCARPPRPVFWEWDANASLCSDYNMEATITNWIMAMRYCDFMESALDCYERQSGRNATGAAE